MSNIVSVRDLRKSYAGGFEALKGVNLDIQEGASASRLWKDVTLIDPEATERDKVYADLLAYCTRDTWAMVAIHRTLMGI